MSKALEIFMEKASISESVRQSLEELRGRPLKDILSYALLGEIDSSDMYQFLYTHLPEGYPKETFKKFLDIEIMHDRKLRKLFKSLFPNDTPHNPEIKSWVQTFVEKDYRLKTVQDYLDVLKIAMEAEQLAERIYLMIMDLLQEPEHKKIMYELAKDERDHYQFIKREYEFYSRIQANKALEELIRDLKAKE
ncbi:ferritin-like domain-containing protein [Palaeococcus ferrophilus]|uniref:ferritin-like domain-containing protein n=1 Tax=Palaeococcus ferrophilus TaxID=83868 RepID=UPI00064EF58D|nr:ferritin family protein [Palaeococcus ferrophilus]